VSNLRIGTAGWAVPRPSADAFPAEGTTLERYATRFNAAEINSSFHRPHRPATYARWAERAPEDFRFAVKLPKAITHQRRLVGCDDLLTAFAAESAGLGGKRGPLLVQLPPSLAFEEPIVSPFFQALRGSMPGDIVCEPRHPSWFEPDADQLLSELRIARVAADPAPAPESAQPGGWRELAYYRLHGSPRTYWSSYEDEALRAWADGIRASDAAETWVIFDNTASGAAAGNALQLRDLLRG
jgi:uncharacterized protein YecE (DUF72 family)